MKLSIKTLSHDAKHVVDALLPAIIGKASYIHLNDNEIEIAYFLVVFNHFIFYDYENEIIYTQEQALEQLKLTKGYRLLVSQGILS